MDSLKIGVFVGSLRKDSFNRRLARALEALAPPEVAFEYIRIDHLPLYNQDFDANYPPECTRLKQAITACDGLLFVTPEYNRSIPGVLKNAIDIGSRPYGHSAFAGKPAAVCGASIGSIGTAVAQQHLRNILAYLDCPTLGQPEVFVHFKADLIDANGKIGNPDTEAFLRRFVDRFIGWFRTRQPRAS